MNSLPALDSSQPVGVPLGLVVRPSYLDWEIPRSVKRSTFSQKSIERITIIESDPSFFATREGALVSDNAREDNFVEISLNGSSSGESVYQCATIGQIIDLVQMLGPDKIEEKQQILSYMNQILKKMGVYDFEGLKRYLSTLEPPLLLSRPYAGEIPGVYATLQHIGKLAKERITQVQPAPAAPENVTAKDKSKCCSLL